MTSRKGTAAIGAAAACAVVELACSGEAGGNGEMTIDSAGVVIVRNDGADRPLDWRAEELLRLGGTDAGPEAFFLINTNTVRADADGRIYVLDTGNHHVQVFERDGAHLRTMGGQGGGPGELMDPVALLVEADGGVQVLDWGKGAVVRFAADGAIGIQSQMPTPMYMPALVDPGHVLGTIDTVVGDPDVVVTGTAIRQRIMLVRRDGESWEEPVELAAIDFTRPPFTAEGPEDCPMKVKRPPHFTLQPVWRPAGDRILHNGAAEYVIDVTELDGARTSIRRDLPVMDATRGLAAADVGPMDFTFRGVTCEMSAEARVDQIGWADRIPWIKDFSRAPDGRLYVLRRAPGQQPAERIDVFEPDGAYAGTLPPDFELPRIWRSQDEFIRIELDELQRRLVVVYRLVRS